MAATTSQDNSNNVTPEEQEQTRGSRLAAKKAAKAAQKAADKGRTPLAQSKFNELTSQLSQWATANQRVIITTGAAAVVIASIAWGWILYSSKADSEAANALKKAAATSIKPVRSASAEAEQEPEANADESKSYESAQARATSAAKEFGAVSAQHPNSRVTAWARVGEGNALLELGKHAQARESFLEALRAAGETVYLKYRALEGLGLTLEAEKKFQEAAQQFQTLAKLADGAYKPYADYYLARVYLSQGQKEPAVKLLGQLLANLDRMSPEQRLRFNFVSVSASAKLLEMGINPDKLKSEYSGASAKTTPPSKETPKSGVK